MVNFGAWDTVPERFKGRRLYRHNPTVTLMRTTVDECRAIGDFLADKLNAMTRPGALPHARRRRVVDRPARPALPRPRGRPRAVRRRSSSAFAPAPTGSSLRLPLHINDEAFADALVAAWREVAASAEQRQRLRPAPMPRIARQTLLERFRAKIAAGRPIIGGGAGTGLSAKCEEAGGIDLIVIYNSGRYRMAGRGSLAGLLAYGNANEIVCEMAHEVLPVVKHTPVLAGVNGTDPFMIPDAVPAAADRPRLLRRAELPDRRPDRRHLPRQPRGNRHGLRPRGRADRARPRARPADHALRLQRGRTRATWPRPAPTSSSATSA